MVAVLLAGSAWVVLHARAQEHAQTSAERRTTSAIERVEREIRIRSGAEQVELNGRGWPVTIDPSWFGSEPPANALLKGARPWLEVASWDERDLEHPVIRQAVDRSIAAFWYNPGNGIVRARVGVTVSDKIAIDVYNRVNTGSITRLVDAIDVAQTP